VALLGGSFGCNGVLGIEQARLDPSLDASEAAATDDATGQAADAGEDATLDDGSALNCTNYCNVIMQNCTGVHQEYLSKDVCKTLCSYMLPGVFYPPAADPDNVDTLGCRLWHATVAATNPTVHCRHAGPLGAELCGTGGPCEPFCSLDWHYCTDDQPVPIPVYDGQVMGCESVCKGDAGYVYVEGDSGDIADPSGGPIDTTNTLNCRLWHLETAIFTDAAATHCPHTGEISQTCQ
jgi:hypothetical protein